MALILRPVAHAEVFFQERDGRPGTLVHSSRPDEFLDRPCPVCGHVLGVKEPVVIFGVSHAHQSCARRGRRG